EEALAVVLPPKGSSVDDVVKQPFVTQWGRDPLWTQAVAGKVLTVDGVRGAKPGPSGRNVTLSSGNVQKVDLAIGKFEKEKNYSREHQEWFCDLGFDLGGDLYWPFLRVALARYQAHAEEELQLSPIVLANFVQLATERTLQVVQSEANGISVLL